MTTEDGDTFRGGDGRVSVIGLGSMGSAIAAALLRAGFTVSVFNRTPARAEQLVEQGAVRAPSAAAAIAASPCTIVCVLDYGAVEQLLDGDGVADALAGRTLVNVCSGMPSQAREIAERVEKAGGDYLDGTIGCFPSAIGTDETSTSYSGSPEVHRRLVPVLEAIGRDQRLVGTEVGVANALQAVATVPHVAMLLATFEAAVYAEAHGVDFPAFVRQLVRSLAIIEPYLQLITPKLASGDSSVEGSNLDVYVDALENADRDMRSVGIRSVQVDALLAVMREAAGEGYSTKELGFLVEFFRSRQQPPA